MSSSRPVYAYEGEDHAALREQARRFKQLSLEDRRRILDEWVPSERSGDTPPD